jgi:hypothetical protein
VTADPAGSSLAKTLRQQATDRGWPAPTKGRQAQRSRWRARQDRGQDC